MVDGIKRITLNVINYGQTGQTGVEDFKRYDEVNKWLGRKEHFRTNKNGCYCFEQLAPQSPKAIVKWLRNNLKTMGITKANGCKVYVTITELPLDNTKTMNQQYIYKGYIVR